MRTIKLNSMLVGGTKRLKVPKDPTNKDFLDAVCNIVVNQFGDRPIAVYNKDRLFEGKEYPEFYVAGWFVSDPISKGLNSELVVIEHGSSMEGARKKLLNSMSNIDWNSKALDI